MKFRLTTYKNLAVLALCGTFTFFFKLQVSSFLDQSPGKRTENYNYAKLYDRLYETGYHNLKVNSNAFGGFWVTHNILLRILLEPSYGIETVLDVGCSHGMAVAALWDFDMTASGMDVSKTAVSMAGDHAIEKYVSWSHNIKERDNSEFCEIESKRLGSTCLLNERPDKPRSVEKIQGIKKCQGECFRQGSATTIPWPDSSFDAILSTDVLEHIYAKDIPLVISEFCRVVNKYLFLQIAEKHETNTGPLEKVKGIDSADEFLSGINSLHLTTEGKEWWIKQFESTGGFRFVRDAHAQGSFVLEKTGNCKKIK